MTVIAGYLGAGKTTLINRLLAENHGLRLLVMVNDFGAINIDEKLLTSGDDDTLTLTNGCVCCTMGADLFMAIGDALDRRPRPDHLIIEASGIADPARIANAAKAEPDLTYGGVVTVVDGNAFETLAKDPMIGSQIIGQVKCAQVIAVSKSSTNGGALASFLQPHTAAPIVTLSKVPSVAPLILEPKGDTELSLSSSPHPSYVSWSYTGDTCLTRTAIKDLLAKRPKGIFRLKGVVKDPDGSSRTVQIVGNEIEITASQAASQTTLVAIGLKDRVRAAEIDAWWSQS
jgi:G3E family GTPase